MRAQHSHIRVVALHHKPVVHQAGADDGGGEYFIFFFFFFFLSFAGSSGLQLFKSTRGAVLLSVPKMDGAPAVASPPEETTVTQFRKVWGEFRSVEAPPAPGGKNTAATSKVYKKNTLISLVVGAFICSFDINIETCNPKDCLPVAQVYSFLQLQLPPSECSLAISPSCPSLFFSSRPHRTTT